MESYLSYWEISGANQIPTIAKISGRIFVLSDQSANVERVCKTHKVIYMEARNNMHFETVQRLIFTYVDLRLIRKCEETLVIFYGNALRNFWKAVKTNKSMKTNQI